MYEDLRFEHYSVKKLNQRPNKLSFEIITDLFNKLNILE